MSSFRFWFLRSWNANIPFFPMQMFSIRFPFENDVNGQLEVSGSSTPKIEIQSSISSFRRFGLFMVICRDDCLLATHGLAESAKIFIILISICIDFAWSSLHAHLNLLKSSGLIMHFLTKMYCCPMSTYSSCIKRWTRKRVDRVCRVLFKCSRNTVFRLH